MARLGDVYVLKFADSPDEDTCEDDMIYEAYSTKEAVVESYCQMRGDGWPAKYLDIIKAAVYDSADD